MPVGTREVNRDIVRLAQPLRGLTEDFNGALGCRFFRQFFSSLVVEEIDPGPQVSPFLIGEEDFEAAPADRENIQTSVSVLARYVDNPRRTSYRADFLLRCQNNSKLQ